MGRRGPPPPRTLLPVPRSYGLMRQTLLALPSFGSSPRSESLCRLLPAPAASGFFPTLSLQIFPQMPGPLPRRVPPSARTCFFPDVIGLPQDTMGRLPVLFRERDFPRVSCRGCRHFFMFRPLSLRRLPDRSYRCEFPHRAAETFTSGHIVLCYLRTLRICYPSDTGN
jgi:hypothetical protein